MADKRVFSISINGIKESTDAVKALKDQLKDVESIIKRLENSEIKIKVSGAEGLSKQQSRVKVSGGNGSDDKLALEIEKEKTKQMQLQNEQYREQLRLKEELKQQNKEALDDIKQQSKGYTDVVDGVKTYANTLNGLSAELKDIKKELRNTDMGSDEFKYLTERANELTNKLKDAEQAYGQFGRNVGNYTQSIIDALREWDETKEFSFGDFQIVGAENSINALKQQLKELKEYWNGLSPDDANFDKTANAIKNLTKQIADMESKLKDAGDAANTSFTGRFTTTIGGVEASFSNASEACEALRKKLVAMRVAGEQNTPMYNEIIQLVRRLQKEVQGANREIEGMSKTSKNIGRVVGVLKGLSGIGALGQGIAGLFGGNSEELDKMIQKFASLSLVLQGLSAIQEELEKGTSSFARFLNGINNVLEKAPLLKQLNEIKIGVYAKRDMEEAEDILDELSNKGTQLLEQNLDAIDSFEKIITNIDEIKIIWDNLSKKDKIDFFSATSIDDLQKGSQNLRDLADALQEAGEQNEDLDKAFNDLLANQKQMGQVMAEGEAATEKYGEAEVKLRGINNKLSQSIILLAAKTKLGSRAVYMAAVTISSAIKMIMGAIGMLAISEGLELIVKSIEAAGTKIKQIAGQLSEEDAEKINGALDGIENRLNNLSKEYDIQIKIGNMTDAEKQLQELEDRLDELTTAKANIDYNDQFSEWQSQLINNLDEANSKWISLTTSQQAATKGMQDMSKIKPEFFDDLKKLGPEDQLKKIDKAFQGNIRRLSEFASLADASDKDIEQLLDTLSDIDWDLNDIGVDGVKAFAKIGRTLLEVRKQAADAISGIKGGLDELTSQNYSIRLSIDATDADAKFGQLGMTWAKTAEKYGFQLIDGKFVPNGGFYTSSSQRKEGELLQNNYDMEKSKADKELEEARKRKADEANRAKEDAKRAADQARQKARAAAQAAIEAMKDGYDKELALNKQKWDEELEDAGKTGKKIADINTIYSRQELEIKKKYAKYLEDARKEHQDKLMDIARDFLSEWRQLQQEIEDAEADTQLGKAQNKKDSTIQNSDYDLSVGGQKGLELADDYYKRLLDADIEYINEKERLDREAAERDYQRQMEDEDNRYNQQKEAQKRELEDYKQTLQDKVDNAQISQEEADKMLKELQDTYNDNEAKSLKQHNDKIASLAKHREQVLKTIELQGQKDRQSSRKTYYDKALTQLREFMDKANEEVDKVENDKGVTGIVNLTKWRKNLKDALDAAKVTLKEISDKKVQLQKDLDEKKISFDDFTQAKKELDSLESSVEKTAKEIKEKLQNSFNTFMGQVMTYISSYTSVLKDMYDTINEMRTRELDQQEKALDKEQELLDKELEMIEEKLSKQQDITKEYSDKINSAEDELKNARGDRREALIDQLAAQRKAMEESIRAENKQLEEKKKIAKKEEAIKKEKDAIEKKRREQEKKAAIVQATINAFSAYANALAVQPWFVGVALGAVALGLGMANVAQIASQKYADGGLLNGRSHSQGGMKIQGTNIEVEGNEYVVNKRSTVANLPLLDYINSNRRTLSRDDLLKFYDKGNRHLINQNVRRTFAEGGQLPELNVDVKELKDNVQQYMDNRPIQVSVVDIIDKTNNLREVQTLAGIN